MYVCVCAINSTKIVFMMCLLRCIYDVRLLYSIFFQYGYVCLVPYIYIQLKKRFSAAPSGLLKCIAYRKNVRIGNGQAHALTTKWHKTPSKKIIIYSIGFLLGSFSKSSFSLFAFFVCLIVCLIHLLCDDLLWHIQNVTNVERCK